MTHCPALTHIMAQQHKQPTGPVAFLGKLFTFPQESRLAQPDKLGQQNNNQISRRHSTSEQLEVHT